jgi:heme/copper-type cytochrome/quinol oxidase subunit 1
VSSRLRIAGLVALVVALLVTGAVLWFGQGVAEFGWFAYAPLDEPTPPGILMTGRGQVALLVSSAGLVLLGGVVGFLLGRRSRSGSSA